MQSPVRLGSVLISLLISMPFVSPALNSLAASASSTPAELKQQAIQDRAQLNANRRAYVLITQECVRRQEIDKTVVCPNINDEAAIKAFMQGLSSSSSSISSSVPVLTLQDVTYSEMALLRRYQKVQLCPETLKEVRPGFYQLCLSYIEKPRQTVKTRTLVRKINDRLQKFTKSSSSSSTAARIIPPGVRPDR